MKIFDQIAKDRKRLDEANRSFFKTAMKFWGMILLGGIGLVILIIVCLKIYTRITKLI